nr:reverse transcriptase domain-containing protein [Tanacetum cinerariifolium]
MIPGSIPQRGGRLSVDDANKHLDKFLHVTQSIKVNGVTDDALHLYLFPHSLTHHATVWFDHLPRNSINTFEQMSKMFLGKNFPPSMVTKLRNEITNFRQRPDELLFEAWECYKLSIVTPSCDTCGGPHSYNDCLATVGQTQNVYAVGAYQGGNSYQPQGLKIPTTSSSLPKVVERETEVTKDTVPPTNNESTKDVQPPVVQVEAPIPNFKPVVTPVIEPIVALVSQGAGFVWESDVGRVGMVREAGNGEIRRFLGVAGNTVHNTMFQTVKDKEG